MICNECETVAHCTSHGCIPKTTKKDEALKQAQHALEGVLQVPEKISMMYIMKVVNVVREALASEAIEQPAPVQQEPYCYTYTENGEEYFAPPTAYVPDNATPLYTSPPAQRKTLTDEEIKAASLQAGMQEHYMGFHSGFIRFARAIEAKLRSKNSD